MTIKGGRKAEPEEAGFQPVFSLREEVGRECPESEREEGCPAGGDAADYSKDEPTCNGAAKGKKRQRQVDWEDRVMRKEEIAGRQEDRVEGLEAGSSVNPIGGGSRPSGYVPGDAQGIEGIVDERAALRQVGE